MTTEVIEEIDLCNELVKAMRILNFSDSSILAMQNNHYYQSVLGNHPAIQRTGLVLAIQYFLLRGPEVVPSDIRISLNVAQDHLSWMNDAKIVLLPFMKANEAAFFY